VISYIIDANLILRYLLNDIPAQADITEAYFRQAKKGTISLTIPTVVVNEVLYVLVKVYKLTRTQLTDKLIAILDMDYLDIEERSIVKETLKFYTKPSISFVDAYLLAKSQITDKELLTFDRRIKRLKIPS